jgi:RNA polymerase sigma-70 factor (ECF subfamily)
MPDEAEVHGLLALMLLSDSRRGARTSGGEIVLLADQDRALWDRAKIRAGRVALDRALALSGGVDGGETGGGPYLTQAAIADLHTAEQSDWERIAALYDQLARLTASPVVALNRAVAVAESQGPQAGLAAIEGLALEDYHYLHATRGELLRRLDRPQEAADAYRRALQLVSSEPERRFLQRRLRELS